MVNFQYLLSDRMAQRRDIKRPKMKVNMKHTNTGPKMRSEVVHTYLKYYTNFINEPFRFSRDLKTFKPPTNKDNDWYEHEPRSVCSKVHDPLSVIDHERLTRL